MIALILSTVFSLFFFTSFGLLFKKIIRFPITYTDSLFGGLIFTNTLVCWLSLLFPINQYILAFFLMCSVLLVFFFRKELKDILATFCKDIRSDYWILFFVLVGLVLAVCYPDNNDTALYHLQTIKWIEDYRVIPGLANVHGRFGFNPNIFTLCALTSLKFIFNQEVFSLNLSVFIIFIGYLLYNLKKQYTQTGISNIFIFNFIISAFALALPNLSSPSPDYLATVIPLYIIVRVINLPDNHDNLKSIVPLLFLAVYCLTVKLSALPILLIFLLSMPRIIKLPIGKLSVYSLIIILIITPWLIRNVILSGWLIYPFPSVDLFHFDWKVPLSKVIFEKEAVTGWARYPHVSYPEVLKMSLKQWVPIWWGTLMQRTKVCIILAVLCPLFGFFGTLTGRIKVGFLKQATMATAFIGVIFWFIMAPDFRFGSAFILTAAICCLLFIQFQWKPINNVNKYFFVVMTLLFAFFVHTDRHYVDRTVFHDLVYSNRMVVPLKIKIPGNRNFRELPVKGGVVYVPVVGDQCYDHEIPCTPNYDPTLTLRGLDFEMGFRTKIK